VSFVDAESPKLGTPGRSAADLERMARARGRMEGPIVSLHTRARSPARHVGLPLQLHSNAAEVLPRCAATGIESRYGGHYQTRDRLLQTGRPSPRSRRRRCASRHSRSSRSRSDVSGAAARTETSAAPSADAEELQQARGPPTRTRSSRIAARTLRSAGRLGAREGFWPARDRFHRALRASSTSEDQDLPGVRVHGRGAWRYSERPANDRMGEKVLCRRPEAAGCPPQCVGLELDCDFRACR